MINLKITAPLKILDHPGRVTLKTEELFWISIESIMLRQEALHKLLKKKSICITYNLKLNNSNRWGRIDIFVLNF